jgi:hypothetical protein
MPPVATENIRKMPAMTNIALVHGAEELDGLGGQRPRTDVLEMQA